MLPTGVHTFLVVGSYHFLDDSLLVFWGHENIRACVSNVDPQQIAWYSLPPRAGKPMNLSEPNGYKLE